MYQLPGRPAEFPRQFYHEQQHLRRVPLKILAAICISLACLAAGIYWLLSKEHSVQPAPVTAAIGVVERVEELPAGVQDDVAGHAVAAERFLSSSIDQLGIAERALDQLRDANADQAIDRLAQQVQAARRGITRARQQIITIRVLMQTRSGRAQ